MHIDVSPKFLFRTLNQIFEIERKASLFSDGEGLLRQVRRLRESFEDELNLSYSDPLGEAFNETRTDVEARVSGDTAEDLIIVETLKPIIRVSSGLTTAIVQKGIVVVGPRIH